MSVAARPRFTKYLLLLAFVACALGLEVWLRKTRLGMQLRAVGSDEEAARTFAGFGAKKPYLRVGQLK